MRSILDVVKEFFLTMFGGSSDEVDQKKKLRLIRDQLKNTAPNYFNTSRNEVLPGFASTLYKLYMALRPVKQIIDKTLKEDNLASSTRWCSYLIEERLPEEQREERYRFTHSEMKKRVESGAELDTIKAEFQEFIRGLSQTDHSEFNSACNGLNRLANLCRYDYDKLLKNFDEHIDLNIKEYSPAFRSVTGGKIVPEIMDFYYLAAGFQITNELIDSLYSLLDRLVSEDKRESYKQKTGQVLFWLQKVLNSHLSKDVLTNLLRAIHGDPAFTPKSDQSWHTYSEDYITRIEKQFDQDWERLCRTREEGMVNMDLTLLFNKAELLGIQGYAETLSADFANLELNSFTHIKPFQILMSFLLMKFEKDLKDAIERVLVDGFFEDKAFQASLTSAVYECGNGLGTINQFEQELLGGGKFIGRTDRVYINAYNEGKKVVTSLNNLIISIDKKAGQIIEDITNKIGTLGRMLVEIINDYKLKAPTKISNIKVLGGEKNYDLMKLLVERAKDIKRFINIMKRFTIIQAEFKPAKNPVA